MQPRLSVYSAAMAIALVITLFLPATATGVTYEDVPRQSWHVNGRVYATTIVGDTVYVGGDFTQATSPSGQIVNRRNLAAFSMSNGELRQTFTADASHGVRALVSDGSALYVGGYFSTIRGVNRSRLAKVDLHTGAVNTGFRASPNAGVLALDVQNGWLYAGGIFQSVQGESHERLVKLGADTGTIDSRFQASTNGTVRALVKNPVTDVLYVSGNFSNLSGARRVGVGGVSATSGAPSETSFAFTVQPILSLDVREDGSQLFGALGAGSNNATAWSTSTGARQWHHRAEGDVQAVHYYDGELYFGFHEGYQGDASLKLLVAEARTGVIRETFKPQIDQFWGVFGIAASEAGLVAGGEFTQVSGVAAGGFVRFPPGIRAGGRRS